MDLYEIDELFDQFRYGNMRTERFASEECQCLLRQNKVIIYGAGNCGGVLCKRLQQWGVDVVAFWDEKGSIHGDSFEGIPILDCSGISEMVVPLTNYIVIVTLFDILSYQDIKKNICSKWSGLDAPQVFYFTQLRKLNKLFSLTVEPRFSAYLGENLESLYAHRGAIKKCNELLQDEESKRVYKELFNYFFVYDFVDFTVHPFEEHYFDFQIYEKREDEVFVDCGAYRGDTLDIFLQKYQYFEKYIAIEADSINYELLKKKTKDLLPDKVLLLKEYIGEDRREIRFDSSGTSYASSSSGRNIVMSATLDDLVYSRHPTFIKINIEGADLEAIRGAKRIIKDFSPVVACQGHHRMEHLWGIIETMEEYGKGIYRYYLRNYKGITEYTFYAIPNNRQLKKKV